jgi:hypothetical protein
MLRERKFCGTNHDLKRRTRPYAGAPFMRQAEAIGRGAQR